LISLNTTLSIGVDIETISPEVYPCGVLVNPINSVPLPNFPNSTFSNVDLATLTDLTSTPDISETSAVAFCPIMSPFSNLILSPIL
jgi:hypothetical protein